MTTARAARTGRGGRGQQFGLLAAHVDGLLRLEDGGGRLEGGCRKTMSSPLLMPPCTPPEWLVAVRIRPPFDTKASLCLRALEQGAGKTTADLKALGRRQREHGLGQVGLEPVEHRFTQADGHIPHAALDDAADGIARAAGLLMRSIMRAAVLSSGQRTALASTSASVGRPTSGGAMISWICVT